MWEEFGFRESPYTTEPVPATEEGDHLLVGRSGETRKLESRILAGGNHPTLEGDNGVGKTSLLQVVCYRLRTAFEEGRSTKLFLPLEEFFQPDSANSADHFTKKVYFQVASAIIREYNTLKRHATKVPDIADVKAWLGAPVMRNTGASMSIFGIGGGLTREKATNASEGFTDSGFMAIIDTWLRQLFPTSQSGGFICVIDNLELLETTQHARTLLEAIRDPLLNRRGLRWILCGARGIVRTSVSSPRLEGRLAEPLEIEPISDENVAAAVKRRIEVCGLNDFAVPPVGPDTFQYLYDVLHQNLRNAFKYAEDFSHWLVNEDAVSGDANEYHTLFDIWLTEQADSHLKQTELRNRAWKVFDDLAARGGSCSPSDFRDFGFNSTAAMRPHIKSLEQENLVSTTLNDESDKRRKTIVMTPRGWLAQYARDDYRLPANMST